MLPNDSVNNFRILTREDPNPVFMQSCEDDGETHAGSRMLHLLQVGHLNAALITHCV